MLPSSITLKQAYIQKVYSERTEICAKKSCQEFQSGKKKLYTVTLMLISIVSIQELLDMLETG